MSVNFADLGLPREIISVLEKSGITEPFPIQAATIADALAGRDVCGRAPTGAGKTLAFGLPIIANLKSAQPRRPHALILSPTRELAEQIRRELAPIAAVRKLRLLTVYGGVSYHPQRQQLRRGVDVLIACPGRLMDLLSTGDVILDAVTHVVVDEADRMADMGFMPQVKTLLDETPDHRQTLLFSATLDGDTAVLSQRYQHDPVRHEVGADAQDAGTARHHFWKVSLNDRVDCVADLVSKFSSTLVFTRTRHGADRLAKQLSNAGLHAIAIHGGLSQSRRDRAMRDFSRGNAGALVATDVAARGIHVDGVECVVHFDPPEDHKTYLHRSGRTARAGASGHVVSMVLSEQARDSRRLQDDLGLRNGVNEPSMDDLHEGGGEILGPRQEETSSGRSTSRRSPSRRSSSQRSGSRSSTGRGRTPRGYQGSSRSSDSRPDSGSRFERRVEDDRVPVGVRSSGPARSGRGTNPGRSRTADRNGSRDGNRGSFRKNEAEGNSRRFGRTEANGNTRSYGTTEANGNTHSFGRPEVDGNREFRGNGSGRPARTHGSGGRSGRPARNTSSQRRWN